MTHLGGPAPGLALLAHQGGWDEVLLIAGPILVIVGLLWVAKRRVDAAQDQSVEAAHGQSGDAAHDRSGDGGST